MNKNRILVITTIILYLCSCGLVESLIIIETQKTRRIIGICLDMINILSNVLMSIYKSGNNNIAPIYGETPINNESFARLQSIQSMQSLRISAPNSNINSPVIEIPPIDLDFDTYNTGLNPKTPRNSYVPNVNSDMDQAFNSLSTLNNDEK